MNRDSGYQIFISYRRNGGDCYGKLLHEVLSHSGYRVFFDNESLSAGEYKEQISNILKSSECTDVLVIVSPGCFDRCGEANDVFYKEIEKAFECNKNVIPLFLKSYEMPSSGETDNLMPAVKKLLDSHGFTFDIYSLDSLISKIKRTISAVPNVHNFISEKADLALLQKIVSSPEIYGSIGEDVKDAMLKNIFISRSNRTMSDILMNIVNINIKNECNLRRNFKYDIGLESANDIGIPGSDPDDYFMMRENLYYTKNYANAFTGKTFKIAFISDINKLDSSFKEEEFFFSESLNISEKELASLCALSKEEKYDFYKNVMRVKIAVNKKRLHSLSVDINEHGIFAEYELADAEISQNQVDIRIQFMMPYLKGKNCFLVSINDITYSPFISFSYNESECRVNMIPFLNRELNAEDANVFDGLIEVNIENEWIIPMSGIVFVIES